MLALGSTWSGRRPEHPHLTYVLNAGVWQVYSTNFRYVKYRLTVQASDSTSLYKLSGAPESL